MASSKNWLIRIVELGFVSTDDTDTRRKKVPLALMPLIIAPAAAIWGAVYFLLGHPLSGSIPMSYALVSVLSLTYYFKTKNTWFIQNSQLTLVLFLPFLLMWSLGGFAGGSMVMLWSIFAPIGAQMYLTKRDALLWFGMYILLILTSVLIDDYVLAHAIPLPYLAHLFFYLLNIGCVSAGLYLLVSFSFGEERRNTEDERKRAQSELAHSEMKFRTLYESTIDAVMLLDERGFFDCNQATLHVFGCTTREDFCSKHPADLSPPQQPGGTDSMALANEHIAKALAQNHHRFEWVHRRADNGQDFQTEVLLNAMELDGRRVLQATVRDITEKKESEELLWQQANSDILTGLPNRRMFYDRLEQEIKKSHRSGLPMALLLLDLDRFKEVNDTLGHAQGDVLLVEAARRIAECVRESDTVARLGGDEFTVLLSEVEDTNRVERIAQNIIERLAAPFQLLQETAYVSASVGITLYPDDAQNIDTLMKNADQAMYLAKNSGCNRFRYFTAALQEAAQTYLRLRNDLRGALVGQQFRVFYQPIVTLANGAIHKAEVLLRWQHPTRGFISPAEFIPVAEETGMIIDIGDWVFREVASQAAHWRASHYAKFQISVNVSPVQFRHNGTNFNAWLDYLQELGLPGQNIVMEITEGLLLDANTSVTDQLLVFRDAGIRVSLDDFGTGYSSLSYLKKFDIDYLKIDQSFVRNLGDDPDDKALCEAIIVMAHKLGLKVIAEGVETEQQRDLLAAYGCDYAQGWLYSKAVPAEQFEALLREQAK
jgi:diguanylate cyclase (GGDEF)-like protein/PAS domain S-box-containing protein